MRNTSFHLGFTLVELSIVLVIIALISGMGLSAGLDAVETSRRVSTEEKMNGLEDALFAFRKKYGRLPCPADATLPPNDANYGLEAENLGSCTGGTPAATYVTVGSPAGVPSGAVPTRTLSLPDEFILDGWGRKFHYEVTPAMTVADAFLDSQFGDDCSITAQDHSGNDLPILPVYALVSYGRNGIGSYLEGGTQHTQGTAGAAEQTNIRTVTNTPTVRIKNGVSGTPNSSGYYDDIVRVKARYQLLDNHDRMTPRYDGADLVLSHNTSSGIQLVYGKKTCGEFKAFSGTVPSAVGASPKFMGFTSNNTNLFVYHTNSCKLYDIDRSVFSAVSESTPVPNCPSAATVGAIAHENGMVALNDTSSPYVQVWQMVGSGDSAKYTEWPNALFPAVAAIPSSLSFSANGEYLAVARSSATAYARLYAKKNKRYQDIGTLPNDAYTEYSNAISPNGKYYAIAVISGGSTQIYVWRNINGEFSQIEVSGSPILYTVSGMTAPSILTFSPDSTYLAVGGSSAGNNLVALYLNPVTETLSAAATLNLSPTPAAAAFSEDSRFMAVARASTGDDSLAIYRREGISFTEDTLSDSFTFNAGVASNFVAFSR